MKILKTSDMKVKFGVKNEPKDEELIKLLKQAYQGGINCYEAVILSEGITPYSINYRPHTPKELLYRFEEYFLDGNFPYLVVYQKGGKFIMSDDYHAFYFYKKKGFRDMACLIVGKAESPYIIRKSKPFKLPFPPQVEIFN